MKSAEMQPEITMGKFTNETAVTQITDKHWRGEVHQGWRIGTVPNGGYILAIAGQALREALPHKDPLTVNAYYLAPTQLGPIDCKIEILRAGRNTTQAEVKMYQQGELKVQVTAAYTTMATLKGENWSRDARPDIPSWEDCPIHTTDKIEFRQSIDLRFASGGELFRDPKKLDSSGEFSGWAQLKDEEAPDLISLLMFADAFPPPVFTLFGPVGWVPTIELSVQLRAHPAAGPIQAVLRSRHLTRGIVEEDGEFWDSAGDLVAISRQTAKVRL
jgi:acyl-CoA thioesterase